MNHTAEEAYDLMLDLQDTDEGDKKAREVLQVNGQNWTDQTFTNAQTLEWLRNQPQSKINNVYDSFLVIVKSKTSRNK